MGLLKETPKEFFERNRESIDFWIREGLLLPADGRSERSLLQVTQMQLDRYYQLKEYWACEQHPDPYPHTLDTLNPDKMLYYIEKLYTLRSQNAGCGTPEQQGLSWLKEAINKNWRFIHGKHTPQHRYVPPTIYAHDKPEPSPELSANEWLTKIVLSKKK